MFEARREKFLKAIGPGAVALIPGAVPAPRANDTEFRFRQDSDFHYLTGFDHPNALAVFRGDGNPGFVLFCEPRDRDAEIWNGYRPGVEGAVADYGAERAFPRAEFTKQLPTLLANAERVYFAPGRARAVASEVFSMLEAQRLASRLAPPPPDALIDPRGILHEMRLRKTPEEIALLQRAAEITREAHAAAARLARAGVMEYEIEALLDYTFRRRGGWGAAYGSIVAGGARATTLHYVANDQPLKGGELLLIDAGCEFAGYASDVTRTYPVGGAFRPEARALYEVVLEAQQAALAACRPGATLPALHEAALRVLVRGLVDFKLLEGEVDALIESEAYRRYYMHGTSHWIGLDVHDAGAYHAGQKPRALEPGMVFSVEPGLYVAAHDGQAPPALRGVGVRIEDDVVITEDGHLNLNADIPKQPEAVEAWVREGDDAGH